MTYTIAALYRFTTIADPAALREHLIANFTEDELCGTLLIATEGVNGTLAASSEVIDRLLETLAEKTGLDRSEVKFSYSDDKPFGRLKFKVKPAILTFRNVEVDPNRPGKYIDTHEWNQLIADPEVLLLDTRNTYETEVGTFEGAVDPRLNNFSDFVTYVRENLDPAKHRKVAMFCTGGIRCEKASAFMLQEGFPEVYHLKGGILKYLEDIPKTDSMWQGDCFVFDNRRAVSREDFEAIPSEALCEQPAKASDERSL